MSGISSVPGKTTHHAEQAKKAAIDKSQKPDAAAEKSQKPDAAADKSQKPDATVGKSQKPDAAVESQKPDAAVDPSQKTEGKTSWGAEQPVDTMRDKPPAPSDGGASAGVLEGLGGIAGAARGQGAEGTAAGSPVERELAMRPGAQQALARLSPEERDRFMHLAENHASNEPPHNVEEARDQAVDTRARTSLYTLLERGRLGDRDSQGHSLLDNLDHLNNQQMAPGLDRREIFAETAEQVADPDHHISQEQRGTCTVTTLQYQNATRQPSEYVRIMSGLTSPDGHVQLRNGDTMGRADGVLQPDTSGRTATNRIYQASMMDYADGAEHYDNATDQHIDNSLFARLHRGVDSLLGITPTPEHGLPVDQLANAMNSVLGRQYESRGTDGVDRSTIEGDLHNAIQGDGGASVTLRWDNDGSSTHELLLERMDDRYVYMRNPWGDGETGNPFSGPAREVVGTHAADGGAAAAGSGGRPNKGGLRPKAGVDNGGCLPGGLPPPGPASGGQIRMTREEFYARLNAYIVPSQG